MPNYTLNINQPTKLGTFDTPTKVKTRVAGPGTLIMGHDLSQVQQGIGWPQTQADGSKEFEWIGELWAGSTDPGTSNLIEVPQLTAQQVQQREQQQVDDGRGDIQDAVIQGSGLVHPALPPLIKAGRGVAKYLARPAHPDPDATINFLRGLAGRSRRHNNF